MLLKYFYDKALAHASYLVGCQRSGEAIVIDPSRSVDQYLDAAKEEGLKIVGSAETHIHADFVSGSRELADRCGAKLYLSDEGPADWKYQFSDQHPAQLLKDGDRFLFAVAGMIGAPLGSMLADQIAEPILLASFALLMIMIAGRMWLKASDPAVLLPIIHNDNAGPTCRRDPEGKLRLTSQCAMLLGVVGLGSGVLAGMFGVGGGFIIVPALITFSCMGMQRAIGTSLLVITLVSISGTASYLIAGKELSLQTAGLFGVGSLAGLFIGGSIANRLKGPTLQRAFAAAILSVAIFVIFKSWLNT